MRTALVRLSLAGALAAAVLGARHSWPDLTSQRAHLTQAEAERESAVNEGLPVDLFDAMRSQITPGDRWWLEIPSDGPDGTARGAVYRTYALYWLLPAVPAASLEQATDVFRVESAP